MTNPPNTPTVLKSNPELQLAFDYVQYTDQHVFLTGKAGTGKTTFLHQLRKHSPKRMIVVAPTGVAAINAGGVTIHSFFQISFGPQIPQDPDQPRTVAIPDDGMPAAGIKRFSREKINIMRSLDLLVIDEISMVRADVLDGIDEVLRRFRKRNKPFGGVQLLMIGDLQQLAPIVRDEDWDILKNYYDSCFFFSSHALRRSQWVGIELKQIFRQSDLHFIELLNKVRENKVDEETLAALNQRYRLNFKPDDSEGYITLTTHNRQAQDINETKLNALTTKAYTFKAEIKGEFPDFMYPTDDQLKLKKGAQVMFVKNDPSVDKRYYNGKIGTITAITDLGVEVTCPGDTFPVDVEAEEWQNVRYVLNEETQEIDEEIIGTFKQIPLKLAWAITIHKSQGLTFEKAIINARLSFAHGQVYVALSRCRSLDGLVLSSRIMPESVKHDSTVLRFTSQVEKQQPGAQQLMQARTKFQQQLLNDLFDFQPFLRQIYYLLKLCEEHNNQLIGNLPLKMKELVVPVKQELIEVSDKFVAQLCRLFAENPDGVEESEALQERIRKAAVYFHEKLNGILIEPLGTMAWESDNRETRKLFTSVIANLNRDCQIKKACLASCTEGFVLKDYLTVKAKAAIETEGQTVMRKKENPMAWSPNPELFVRLKEWREKKARSLEVELSRILPQKTLLEIAEKIPASTEALKLIKGMGGKKMQQFGRELLELCIVYRRSKGMEVPFGAEKDAAKASLHTREISLDEFRQGKTVEEIATIRELTVATIESHLSYFVRLGQLSLDGLVGKQQEQLLRDFFRKNGVLPISQVKAMLGDAVSFSDIRFVQSRMEAERNSKE